MTSTGHITLGEIASTIQASTNAPELAIGGITLDSNDVQPGDLFVALAGSARHGIEFVENALSRGAAGVWTDSATADRVGQNVPTLISDNIRADLGQVAADVYGNPTRSLDLVGITGTQGKTTTTFLAQAAARGAGVIPAIIGTVGTTINGVPVASQLTTPEAPALQALFAKMVAQKVQMCAMEVSSHALIQGRVAGAEFDVAVFLNLGRDHLDFHGDVDQYFQAKAKLFAPDLSKRGLISIDDEYGQQLAKSTKIELATMSTKGNVADWMAVNIRAHRLGSRAEIIAPDRTSYELEVPLVGAFNVANALAAVASLSYFGYDIEQLCKGIGEAGGIPGRMERIDAGQEFLVVVDYAHKPDAVQAALHALRPVTTGKLIIVLGAGGDRDRGKRPMMGEIAARDADVFIVTDDNPRTEDPDTIRAALISGAYGGPAEILEIPDRRQAIERALAMAQEGDTVIVAGKGHEKGQEVNGKVFEFDDAEVVRRWLKEQL